MLTAKPVSSLSLSTILLTLYQWLSLNVEALRFCSRAEPAAFRALMAAAAQGERQLKDTLVALLLARRDRATVPAAHTRVQSQPEHTAPAGDAARNRADVDTAADGHGDEAAGPHTG